MENIIKKAEDLEVKKPKTTKDVIRNYLTLGLYLEKWNLWDSVPSENALAIKFNCSRLTARNAIQEFVERGILSPFKGKGYLVMGDINNYINIPFDNKFKNYKVTTTKVDKEVFGELTEELSQKLWIQPEKYEINKIHISNEKSKIITYQWRNLKNDKKSSKPRYNTEHVEYVKSKLLKSNMEELGLKGDLLANIQVEYNEEGWITFSVTMKTKDLPVAYNSKHYINY